MQTAIAKDGMLMPSWLCLRVKQVGAILTGIGFSSSQELNGGKEAMPIGNLTINLAEYAAQSHHSSRYVLEDCKMNCALRVSLIYLLQGIKAHQRQISISMEQTSGEKKYTT